MFPEEYWEWEQPGVPRSHGSPWQDAGLHSLSNVGSGKRFKLGGQ